MHQAKALRRGVLARRMSWTTKPTPISVGVPRGEVMLDGYVSRVETREAGRLLVEHDWRPAGPLFNQPFVQYRPSFLSHWRRHRL